jgi:hypothetical protein
MKRRPVVFFILLLFAAGVCLLYVLATQVLAVEPGRFSLGTAILVAGYLLFPVLALLAAGLLLIALMLLAGAAAERRRAGRDR